MVFQIDGLARSTASGNTASTITWNYISADTTTEIETSGYFNALNGTFQIASLLYISGSDKSTLVEVKTITPNVTVAELFVEKNTIEAVSGTITVTGPWAPQLIPFSAVINNGVVNFSLNPAAPNATIAATLIATDNLPISMRPNAIRNSIVVVSDNSILKVGHAEMNPTGIYTMSNGLISGTTFTGLGSTGWDAVNISYVL